MKESLLRHIKRFIPVSGSLAARLLEVSEEKVVEKGTFLHRPGKVCLHTYFICSGLLRVFYRVGEKEVTDTFSAEGEWITSIYSFMRNVPDSCHIETIERCELVSISIAELERCFTDFPEMERFGRILLASYLVEQSERIVSLQFHSARERYEFFCRAWKGKLNRVPLRMLASHLGITQETLSRIRAERRAF